MSIGRRIRDTIQGGFLGVAIGDALGMPVETMSRAEIQKATSGKGVTSFVNPLTDREWMKNQQAGSTTDDWQLTEVVAQSLIHTKSFNLEDMANRHVQALNTSIFGWGKTTKRAIEEIRDSLWSFDTLVPNYGPNTGAGNGIIMKIAPLALHHAMAGMHPTAELLNNVMELGGLTHHDVRASTTAYCVARLMFEVFHRPCRTSAEVYNLLPKIIGEIKFIHEPNTVEKTSTRLKKLLNSRVTESSEELEAAVGNKFHCLDTMAFTIGTFLRHPTDFRAGVLEAVNAGGDSDTNASIVGALIGINCGVSVIPEEWKNFNPDFEKVLELGHKFYSY